MSKGFVKELHHALIGVARWISIPHKCVFDKMNFCICLIIRDAGGVGAMKKVVHLILLVTKREKARKFVRWLVPMRL